MWGPCGRERRLRVILSFPLLLHPFNTSWTEMALRAKVRTFMALRAIRNFLWHWEKQSKIYVALRKFTQNDSAHHSSELYPSMPSAPTPRVSSRGLMVRTHAAAVRRDCGGPIPCLRWTSVHLPKRKVSGCAALLPSFYAVAPRSMALAPPPISPIRWPSADTKVASR